MRGATQNQKIKIAIHILLLTAVILFYPAALYGAPVRESPSFHRSRAVGADENDVSVYAQTGPEGLVDASDLPDFDCDAYILIDRRTSQTICSKNAETILYPASTTKIMTAILAIEMGDMNSMMTASVRAVRDIGPDGSNIGIIAGEKMRLDNLLDALLVRSANETANIIAENLCDTRDEFIGLMNQKAQELGAYNTHFSNTIGTHEDTHYTTAYDLSKIANYAMNNAQFRKIVAQRRILLTPTNKHSSWETMSSTNSLLFDDSIKGFSVTGIKTGFHTEAGYCVVASGANADGMELICVVLGVHGTIAGTSSKRFKIASELLTFGFEHFQQCTFVFDNEPVGAVSVVGGENQDAIDTVSDGTVKLFLPMDKDEWSVSRIDYLASEVVAPVAAGDVVGYIEFRNAGIYAGRVGVVSTSDVPAIKGAVKPEQNKGDTGSAKSLIGAAAGATGSGIWLKPAAAKTVSDRFQTYEWANDGESTEKVENTGIKRIDFASIFKVMLIIILGLAALISILRTIGAAFGTGRRRRNERFYGNLKLPPVRGGADGFRFEPRTRDGGRGNGGRGGGDRGGGAFMQNLNRYEGPGYRGRNRDAGRYIQERSRNPFG